MNERIGSIRGGVALIAMVLLAYSPALRAEFVWDDDTYIENNRQLRDLAGLRRIWLSPGATPQYYPLVFSSYWIEYQLWGLNSTGYHVTNIALHALTALLLWVALREVGVRWAWLAAALFALHPVNVESVAWVNERKNTLSGLFAVLTTICFFRARPLERCDRGREDARFAVIWYGAALLSFAACMLSKTAVCALPFVLLVIIWWKTGRIRARDVAATAPLLAIAAAAATITTIVEHHDVVGGIVANNWKLSPPLRMLIASRNFWFYMEKMLWPLNLAFDYGRWRIDPRQAGQYLLPASVAGIILSAWRLRRQIGPGLLAVILCLGLLLGPALGLVSFYWMRYSFAGDHFLYVPSMAFVSALSWTAWRLSGKSKPAAIVVGAIVLGFFGMRTLQQAGIFRDRQTLWTDAVARNPRSWLGYNSLGRLKMRQNDFTAAEALFRRSLDESPDYEESHVSLGSALAAQGKYDDAIAQFREAIRIYPQMSNAYYNMGNALAQQDRFAEALDAYDRAIARDASLAEAHNGRGIMLARIGRHDDAIRAFEAALAEKPELSTAHYNLANTLAAQERPAEAIAHLREAVRLDPAYYKAKARLRELETGAQNLP